MATLKTAIAELKETDGTAIDAVGRSAPYSTREFATNCFKAGNLLGQYGVHPGGRLAVFPGPKEQAEETGRVDSAAPLVAVLGGMSRGAVVDLAPAPPVETRAALTPAWQSVETAPQCSVLAYGGPPEEPSVAHFERELWSENPTAPPEAVEPTDPALQIGEETFTHDDLYTTAREVIDRHGLAESGAVTLGASLTEPGALVAGVIAPLLAGGRILLPDPDCKPSTETGENSPLAVVDAHEHSSHRQTVRATDVTAQLRDTRRA